MPSGQYDSKNVTTVRGATRSTAIGYVKSLFASQQSPAKISSEIKRIFRSMSAETRSELYQYLKEPYAAAKDLANLPQGERHGARDVPVRNPPGGTLGHGAVRGYHYGVMLDVIFPGDIASHPRYIAVTAAKPLTADEAIDLARDEFNQLIMSNPRYEDEEWLSGGPAHTGIVFTVHKVTR